MNHGTEEMLTLNPKINHIWAYDRKKIQSKKFFNRIKLEFCFLKSIRQQRYDVVIDLDYGDRGAGIALFSGSKIKVGSSSIKSLLVRNTYTHKLPSRKGKHIVEVGLDAIRSLGKKPKNKKLEIHCSLDDEMFVSSLIPKDGFIHLHPFSRMSYKEIDAITISKIIDFCEFDLGYKVVITSAPNNRELRKVDNLLNLCKSKPVDLSGELTLKQTAALNKRAKLFIGVDTAIMHVSSANNVPVFAFFGPSSVSTWGPWDNDLQLSTYVAKGGVQKNGKHTVYSENMDCIGCNQHGCEDTYNSNCLNKLNLDFIKKNLEIIATKL